MSDKKRLSILRAVFDSPMANQEVMTDTEQAFLKFDISAHMIHSALAWDEIEDMGYALFENGYIYKKPPNDAAIYGNGMRESYLYSLAKRMQDGEDIRMELTTAVLGNVNIFMTSNGNEYSIEHGENSLTARYGNVERQISYTDLGDKLIGIIKKEYDDIIHDRTVEDLRDTIPGLPKNLAEKLIETFDNAKMNDWQTNEVVQRRIKKALYDFLNSEELTEKAFLSIADMKYDYKPEKTLDRSTYKIYQLKDGDEYHGIRFMSYDFNKENGASLKVSDYNFVYEGDLSEFSNSDPLDEIFQKFNTSLPDDFKGHSLSVSDVVVIESDGKQTAHYVDDIGFKELPDFFKEKEITIEVDSPLANGGEYPEHQTEKQVESAVDSIMFIGNRNGFEAVKNAAQSNSFGTTIVDGDTITVVIKDNADVNDVRHIVETAQNNGIFLNVPSAKLIESRFGTDFIIEINSPKNPFFSDKDIIEENVKNENGIFEEKTENLKFYPVYKGGWDTNTELYQNIVATNKRFAEMAHEVIGNGKNPKDSVKILTETFGFERTVWLTALNIAAHPLDGRFYQSDKEWACKVLSPYFKIQPDELFRHDKEKSSNFDLLIKGGELYSIHNTHLAQFAENLIPEYEKYLERGFWEEKNVENSEKTDNNDLGVNNEKTVSPLTNNTVLEFRDKTKSLFNEIDGKSMEEIETDVIAYVQDILEENNIKYNEQSIAGVIYGSRSRGLETSQSDIDFVVEIDTHEREDYLFNILNDNNDPLMVSNIKVDINPITPYETGTLETYLPTAEKYLEQEKNDISKKRINHISNSAPTSDIEKSFSQQLDLLSEEINQAEISDTPSLSNGKSKAVNYHIKSDDISAGGSKSQFKRNIEAIKTLKLIESENRTATAEEQEILSLYAGWGGLQNAFDDRKSDWSNEYAQLKSLLTEDEYKAAKSTVVDAFYTPPYIIENIYTALENMGFSGGRVLDPSTGVGNFLGKMPENIFNNSHITAVEKDSISGRIAKALYPSADIKISGYENADFDDNSFDVAVSNIPYGSGKLFDKRYAKENFLIHDYFIAKTLDKVRSGGVIAFITSKGTLDKANPKVREYIAQRADLLGAVRLPNTAFKSYAGTEVTADIIFLQKREQMTTIVPDWVYTDKNEDGFTVNSYFAENPDMVLGQIVEGNKLYNNKSDDTMVVPFENSDLKELMKQAVKKISGIYVEEEKSVKETKHELGDFIPASPEYRNFAYAEIDGKIYLRKNNTMENQNLKGIKYKRVSGMIQIADCVHELLDMQLEGYSEEALQKKRDELNAIYDKFTSKYGLLNDSANVSVFEADVSAPLLISLEEVKDGELISKSAIFTRTTLRPPQEITHVDTSQDALVVSISEKACVDMEFMKELTGKSEEEIFNDLKTDIFLNPLYNDENGETKYLTASEYLSGNIRKKLEIAKLMANETPILQANVAALENVMPEPIPAGEITAQLGSSWIDTKYIEQFIREKFGFSPNVKVNVHHSNYTATWNIENKMELCRENPVRAKEEYGTKRKNAFEIIEAALNLREPTVYDKIYEDGKEKKDYQS